MWTKYTHNPSVLERVRKFLEMQETCYELEMDSKITLRDLYEAENQLEKLPKNSTNEKMSRLIDLEIRKRTP